MSTLTYNKSHFRAVLLALLAVPALFAILARAADAH